ncbi:MAG: Biotin transporter BioY [Firmicutes bacterium ADurb.Bin182]|nr:MAG: Biotin transporter BioY [Firmicutes bacterium ADurb.Bin182]
MKLSVRSLVFAALCTALTAAGAFVKIPIPPYPVPMTLQTFFVFMAGMLLSPKYAFLSQAAYVALGLLGVPVFTSGGGIGYVLNPTFGYLAAFMLAAPLISISVKKLLEKGRKLLFFSAGMLIIIGTGLLGVVYMAVLYASKGEPLAFSYAVYIFLIFIPLDAVKFAVCALISGKIRNGLGGARNR